MDEKTSLHTAARHYCLNRDAETFVEDVRVLRHLAPDGQGWPIIFADSGAPFALGAILLEVERVVPSDFPSLDAVRDFLRETAHSVEIYPVRPSGISSDELATQMQRARQAFESYISGLSTDDLRQITPLAYRRVLGLAERRRLWRRLERRWGISPTTYWYPLTSDPLPSHVQAFWARPFRDAIPPERLRAILKQGQVRHVWELRQGAMHSQYEIEVAAMHLISGPVETYWTSEKMDWLIYASHEDSFTIAGESLLNGVKRAWPQWQRFLRPAFPHY